ncbi:AfsR/SARP family transcriptional regulator [Stackebrandtia nassauensis]|uniref:Transcriptional regulator, SARP family n=1 Tax=Stackebrandtia nassauensis (strain DSM 44728 / CIP 108903 / NRRL B-16338 / NBRC 102104 / LLR-40K-21) TaxID=446470 RepID=D3Q578_STANL|nr:AfsR/SARP family transcriptional regulator [Stackebrandtia nassauensis]ADD44127.1 transcriptional regulator, SARP family [Stackebrandtia nassauensis DSM 44728]
MLQFRVLGPMEVCCDGQVVPTGGGRSKAVLAALLLHANKTVSRPRLIELVWADAPDSVDSNLRSYLAKLRKKLHIPGEDASRLVADPHGFRVVVDEGELDLAEFDALASRGEQALAAEDPATAADCFTRALALWRGPALGGVLVEPNLAAAVAHVEERREHIELRNFEARLALGQHGELIGELRGLISARPLREKPVALLMLALYRSGRQKEALELYRQTRARFRDELGCDPGKNLTELHRRILSADAGLDAPRPAVAVAAAPARVVPSQLPADVPAFTGRQPELAALRQLSRGCLDAEAAGSVVVCALDGMPGIGKTTLAVHAARLLAPDFPDGQLFLDLHGFSGAGERVEPGDALDRMLRALGLAVEDIPAEVEDRAALYRSLLSDRRLLIVLDNAADEAQLRPLLPGGSRCLVIVTSRRRMSALDEVTPIPLDVMSADEATALFLDAAATTGLDDTAAGIVAEVVETCGRLPLAVRIAAARLRSRPNWTLADLRDRLARDGELLSKLEFGQRSVRVAFEMSYRELDERHAHLFRLLGLAPGSDLSVGAVCALLGEAAAHEVETRLEDLVDAHLLRSRRPGRYAFHDLLRAYAVNLTESTDPAELRAEAVERIVDYHVHTAHRATLRLDPLRRVTPLPPLHDAVKPAEFVDSRAARDWFDEELATLKAVLRLTETRRLDESTYQLVWAMETYLSRRGLWADWERFQRQAIAAAERLGDLPRQAYAHRVLGRPLTQLSRYPEACAEFSKAVALFKQLDDPVGQADSHRGLAWAYSRTGDRQRGLENVMESLVLYRKAGNQRRVAHALNGVGWQHALAGEYPQTLDYCGQAIEIFAELTKQHGHHDAHAEAETWDSLGYAHHHLGNHTEAITCYRTALDLLEDVEDRYFTTEVLTNLGDVYLSEDDRDAARRVWSQALTTLDELGHPYADKVRSRLATLDE